MSTPAPQNATQTAPEAAADRLLTEFPPSDAAAWRAAAEALLKGAPFEQTLTTPTLEGITLQPIYAPPIEADSAPETFPGCPPYQRGAQLIGQPWDVAQESGAGTPAMCHAALQHDLQHGQTAIHLVLDEVARHGRDPDQVSAPSGGRGGVSVTTLADLATILADLPLDRLPLLLQTDTAALAVTAMLAEICQQRQFDLATLRGGLLFDPLGALATHGVLPYSCATVSRLLGELGHWAATAASHFTTVAAQSAPYHESGGHAAQELAYTMAAGVAYLRLMQQAGLSIDAAAARIRFVITVGSQFFLEVAKLRAARVLWAKIVSAFGGSAAAQKMTLHVRTARWNLTMCDPHVNLLRTTIEALAGVVGGGDSLQVGAFDELHRAPTEFSRRIARNTQLILQAEAHLDQVLDPAGGSWYVESLTDALARQSWPLFQAVEAAGGLLAALQAGVPQAQISRTAAQRRANFATRKDGLIGTSMYPNLAETPLEGLAQNDEIIHKTICAGVQAYRAARSSVTQARCQAALHELPSAINWLTAARAAVSGGATLGEIEQNLWTAPEQRPTVAPLTRWRAAEPFEAVRQRVARIAAATGQPPSVFLANMGPRAQHHARADFARSFFEVGGFTVLTNPGFASVADAAAAALTSGAWIVVICATDETYPAIVPPLTQQIKAAQPQMVVILAGYPQAQLDAFRQAGVDEFIHLRANLPETFTRILQRVELP